VKESSKADTTEVKGLIRRLQESFNQTLDALCDLPQEDLQKSCAHGCAHGGTARDLLVHNISHEKQHTGQVWSLRDQLRIYQGWGGRDLPTLLASYYTARAHFIAALFGLTDEQLDLRPKEGAWTIRETIDHVLYWERNSIDTLHAESQKASSPAIGKP
jgi:uncharacterized damage-inducible protein DinB